MEKLNPILPEDSTKRNNLKNIFTNTFDDYDFIIEDGEIKGIKKGEERVEDKHGNALTFEQFATQKANALFDFKKQGEKGSAGNTGGNGKGDEGDIKFESEAEYNEYMRTEQDSEKRAKAYEAFNKSE